MHISDEPDIEELQKLLINNQIKFVWHDRVWKCRMYCKLCGKGRTSTTTRVAFSDTCQCLANKNRDATNMDRYGVLCPRHLPEVQARAKQTCMERYGVDNPLKAETVRAKCRNTNVERLGVEYPTQSDEVKEKIKQSNLENFGVPWTQQDPGIRQKSMETNIANLGFPYPTQSAAVNEKRAKTCKAKYGHECSLMSPDVKAKSDITNIKKYGAINPIQNKDVRNRAVLTAGETKRANGYRSIQEKEVEEFVRSLGFETRHYASGGKEIDILIPSLMIGIEFNGIYWHSEEHKRNKHYHAEKSASAKNDGITLIHIWDYLWTDRQEQVKDFIRAKLGKCGHRIGVRKCDFVEVPIKAATEFLEKHHIQGGPKNTITAFGAMLKGELLAVACFGRHHRGGDSLVLSRLCTLPDWIVSGFLGKAVRAAVNKHQKDVISWVDLCLSDGKSYESAGFKLDGTLKPDYFYVGPHGRYISKQSFRKIDHRTEAQRASDEGMHRVWDCGKIRFRFEYLCPPDH